MKRRAFITLLGGAAVSDRLRGIMLRGNALHGVVSYPALLRRMIRG
jgi:hypothetical protein